MLKVCSYQYIWFDFLLPVIFLALKVRDTFYKFLYDKASQHTLTIQKNKHMKADTYKHLINYSLKTLNFLLSWSLAFSWSKINWYCIFCKKNNFFWPFSLMTFQPILTDKKFRWNNFKEENFKNQKKFLNKIDHCLYKQKIVQW